jgi:hypothetical protein
VLCCTTLAARYSRLADTTVDDVSVRHTQKAEQYRALGRQLAASAALATSPFAGGLSLADKQTREQDDDRVSPSFTRTLHQSPPPGA